MSARPGVAARPGRPPLTRERIVDAALGLVRADGLPALSMRALADEVGSAPMSLYRHVADRQDVLVAMLDVIAAGLPVPAPVDDPRAELAGLLTMVRDAFVRDPWVVRLLVDEGLASPLILPVVERVVLALERGGLAGDALADAYELLWHYVYGEAVSTAVEATSPRSFAERMTRERLADYPAIARMYDGARREGDAFARNLDRLLDGVLGR